MLHTDFDSIKQPKRSSGLTSLLAQKLPGVFCCQFIMSNQQEYLEAGV